jgi:hypothetical protein
MAECCSGVEEGAGEGCEGGAVICEWGMLLVIDRRHVHKKPRDGSGKVENEGT